MAEFLISAAQNGGSVVVHVGDVITLRLAENASTGYRWTIKTIDESQLTVQDTGYRSEATSIGSGGEAFWTFRAQSAGKGHLELIHSRPWEGERSRIDRFTLNVEVQPQR